MLVHPFTLPGLGDAGAHCSKICDGGFTTHLLAHWGRDAAADERLPVEWIVKRQCADTAALVGLDDRGPIVPGKRADLMFSGRPSSSDRLEVEWGRVRDGDVQPLGGGEISGGAASEAGAVLPWWFVPEGELPLRPPGANAVRVTFESDVSPGTALALTAPVEYAHEPLSGLLDGSASRSLAFTDQLTYVPCVELPTLHHGIVEVPDHLVVSGDWPSPIADQFTSPFAGVLDLYPLERLPLSDSENPPPTTRVFKVDRRIPGAVLAPAEIR